MYQAMDVFSFTLFILNHVCADKREEHLFWVIFEISFGCSLSRKAPAFPTVVCDTMPVI